LAGEFGVNCALAMIDQHARVEYRVVELELKAHLHHRLYQGPRDRHLLVVA